METETEWEPPEDFNAMEALIRGLTAKANGEPINKDELLYATMMVSCANLMKQGLDFDTACSVVESAMDHGDIRVAWSEEEGLSLTIGEGIVAGGEQS
jgi:hypothetical protein